MHPTAVVAPDAQLGPDDSIDAPPVVGRNVLIATRSRIGPGSVISAAVPVG